MRVLMLPHPDKINKGLTDGISQVVSAYARYLPDYGIKLVGPKAASFDLIAAHAGLTGPEVDVCHLHGIHWSADYDAPEWEWRVNAGIVDAVRHAKVITVPSEWVAETIRRDLRVNPAIIPHGIDWEAWQHSEPLGDYVLWAKNRVDPHICNPMPVYELAQKFPKGHFVSTFLPPGVPAPVNISLTGLIPHDQMKKLVQSALVYLATVKETFGLGILEAMAAGVPVLGYARGGIVDLVVHGQNGYLARPGDLDDLAEGLRYCIQYRDVLGANGRELARAWTWEAACQRVANVYRLAAQEEPATVSVVIPCYNKSEHELRRAVESAANQSLRPEEIIIVDDGSKDDLAATYQQIVGQGHATPIKYIRQNNSGVANARNRGIGETGTKYIACLDGDDWFEPDFLRVCIMALEADRSLGIAYTGLRWHKPDGSTGISQWPGAWDFNAQLREQNQVPTCCVFRREMWQRLGGYRQRYAPSGAGEEDGEFWLRAGAYGWKAAWVEPHASVLTNYHKMAKELKRVPTDDEMTRAHAQRWQVVKTSLFNYSWMSGQVTGDPNHQKTDWTFLHPWTKDAQHPFASYATPARHSHPVRAYDEPAVSVIIPVGPGHEREVINALDSLEAQPFRKWEAIVVWDFDIYGVVLKDDSNVETVRPEIRSIEKVYPYVKFRSTGIDKPRGAGYARNRGAEIARAPFLLFLDADDWLRPLCLENMIKAWNENKAIIYTDYLGRAFIENPNDPTLAPDIRARIYDHNEKTHETIFGKRSFDYDCERALRQPEEPDPYIWCNVTALIPKAWHDAIGGFDESMESWEDVDYHWRMARAGHCYYHLQEELMVYRFYTGTRRDRGLQTHKNLVKYIRNKYEGNEPMACPGGCGKGQSENFQQVSYAAGVPNPFAAMPTVAQMGVLKLATGGTIAVTDADLVKVKFITPNRASRRVTGPSTHDGGAIDYGYHSAGDVFLVHRADVGGMFQPMQEQAVKLPEVEAIETPAPAALPGVEVVPVQSVAPVPAPVVSPPLTELAPVAFEPDDVLASVKSLREFVSSGMASKPMLRVLLDLEREGKARPSAIKELERALA